MKLKISIILSAVILLFSCQRDEDEIQAIDQVLKLYMHNADGQDLLNSKIPGSYSTPTLLDLLGEENEQAVSGYTFPKDADTVVYMDYPAGAIRLLRDSSISPEQKTYYSRFIIRLPKTINNVVVNDDDTIEIEYNWTPSLFQLSKLWYNKELKFTKIQGQPNIVRIVK
ncbi:hypothetical protein [Epilithonimonas sp. UC225_85]|uniref:hypothetical protein n=1 Tax=Epilithonimonas sp. UC225_85 TaxID=3350167 RepID=UPI0036D39440